MDKEKTFEEYKLIHEFMHPEEPLKKWMTKENAHDYYFTQWDWLMPVLEKIEGLVYSIKIHSSSILSDKQYRYSITLSDYKDGELEDIIIVDAKSDYMDRELRISIYYKAVVEFIKWHNKIKES